MRAQLICLLFLAGLLCSFGRATASPAPSLQCSEPQKAGEWLAEVRPLFTSMDQESVEFRQDANVQFVESLTSPVEVVGDSAVCSNLASAVAAVLNGVPYWQANPHSLMMLRLGPYYAVAVDEPSVDVNGVAQRGTPW